MDAAVFIRIGTGVAVIGVVFDVALGSLGVRDLYGDAEIIVVDDGKGTAVRQEGKSLKAPKGHKTAAVTAARVRGFRYFISFIVVTLLSTYISFAIALEYI